VLLTTYDMAYGEPMTFSSFNWPPPSIVGVSMRVAARATSAGPTFLEPQILDVRTDGVVRRRVLVDGGVFANNPSSIAYALGSILAAQAGRRLFLVSLGTGRRNPANPRTPAEIKTQNWLTAARNVFEAAMSGSGEVSDTLLNLLLNPPREPARYVRIQTTVENCNFAMDDSSTANTQCLGQLALRVVEQHAQQLQSIRKALLLQ
jgi:predicted acylesterase/phospholipase RssA